MPLLDKKLKFFVSNSIKCLQCEICHNEFPDLLPGLCASHVFCKACAENNSGCPSCKANFNQKRSGTTFSIGSDILAALHNLDNILKDDTHTLNETYEDQTPSSAQKSATKKDAELPPPSVASSPAKSEVTVISTPARSVRGGRRSVIGSPMPDVNKRNSKGETLIQVACIKNNFEEVKRLLGLGANCCVRDFNGWTPLHEAVQRNQINIAEALLQHGAKVNASGGEEYLSPLHDAVSSGYVDMIKLLLKFGAQPKQISIKGETAKDMTQVAEVLSLLEAAEGKSPTPNSSVVSSSDSALFADGRPLLLMSSALDKPSKANLSNFLKVFGGKTAPKPSGDLKVVVASHENNLCESSAAVLAGIAAGAWIVRPDWMNFCIDGGRLVDPETYELYSPINSTNGQVFRMARCNTENMLPGLFAGCHFFFSNIENFGTNLSKDVVVQIVKVMGGKVLSRSPDPEDISGVTDIPYHANKNGPLAKCPHFIIFEKGKTKKNFIEFNMQHIKALQYSWLIKCIENFSLLDP